MQHTTKKVLTIIKKGPAFCPAQSNQEMVHWKEVQKYRELLRQAELENLQDLKQIRALRETNKRIKQGASSLAEIYN